jgi:hypothetical protein
MNNVGDCRKRRREKLAYLTICLDCAGVNIPDLHILRKKFWDMMKSNKPLNKDLQSRHQRVNPEVQKCGSKKKLIYNV